MKIGKLLPKDGLKSALGLVGGAVAAQLVVKKTATMIGNDKIRAALPLVLGFVLSGQKNAMMKNAGFGMIAVGGSTLIGTMIPSLGISGVGNYSDDLAGLYDEVVNLEGTDDSPLADAPDMPDSGVGDDSDMY